MKKILSIAVVTLLMFSGLNTLTAQTPQYYFNTGSFGINVFPFGSASGDKCQFLFRASDFSGGTLQPGLITKIYFVSAYNETSPCNYTNLNVKIGMTPSAQFANTNWVTGLTTALPAQSYSVAATSTGDWFVINLSTPIYYDGTSNFIVEVSQTGYTNGFGIRQPNNNIYSRIYGNNGSPSGNGRDKKIPYFGFDMIPSTCSGTPTAGITQADASPINCNTTTILRLNGNSQVQDINFQWQYNTGSGWTSFGTNIDTQVSPPIVTPTQFRCILLCTNSNLSDTSTPVTVNVNMIPVSLGIDTFLCPGVPSITLAVGSTGPGNTYLWNTNATTPSIAANDTGLYDVLVTYPNGCFGRDTVYVAPGFLPTNNLPDSLDLCVGSTTTLDAGNPGDDFLWNTSDTTQSIIVNTGGIYSVNILNDMGCVLNPKTIVNSRPLPIVDLGPDTSMCATASIILDATNPPNYTYAWNTGDSTAQVLIADSGTIKVVVTSPYNCITEDSVHVALLPGPRVSGFNFIPVFGQSWGKVQFFPILPTDVMSYEWDFGDGSDSATTSSPAHIYTKTGDYVVSVTVTNGCGTYTSSLPIHVDLALGIVTIKDNAVDLVVYPNPASQSITIKNNSAEVQMKQIYVYSVLGRKVYETTLSGVSRKQISVENLASGVYSLIIVTNNNTRIVRRFEVKH